VQLVQNRKELTLHRLESSLVALAHAVCHQRQNPTDRNQKQRNVQIVNEKTGMTRTLVTPVCSSHVEKETLVFN
jgi:hypothetical protein